jgi:hypothetical protein
MKPTQMQLASIWFNQDRTQYYLITDIETLPSGDRTLVNATGAEHSVQAAALTPYEVTREEAQAWLKAQLGDVLGQLRSNIIHSAQEYFDARRPSAHESPAELLEHADAIETVAGWLQGISQRTEDRLRTKAEEMRAQAAEQRAADGQPENEEPASP